MSRYQAHAFHAERRRVMEQLKAQDPVTDRLYGRCGLCSLYHRQPDVRYRCGCGDERCATEAERLGYRCPECGSEMRMVAE